MSIPRVLLSITTPDEGSTHVRPIPSAEDFVGLEKVEIKLTYDSGFLRMKYANDLHAFCVIHDLRDTLQAVLRGAISALDEERARLHLFREDHASSVDRKETNP